MAAPAPATTATASAETFLDGRIDIVVKGAREIRANDIGGTSDAYCKIGLIDPGTKHGWLDKPAKSKPVTSLTPVWDFPFSFIVNCSKATELRIKVYDSDLGKDDVLGEVTLHPQTLRYELAGGKKVKKALSLTMPGDGGVSRRNYGYVDVEFTYTPDPSPAAQQRKRDAASKLNAQKEIALRKEAEKKGQKYIPKVDFSKFRAVRDLPKCFRAFIHNGNGLYLRVKPGKEGTVLAVASPVEDRQVWEITFIGDQHVQLKNLTMNRLMTAEKWVTTIGDVTCRCPLPGHTFERWEMFPIEAEPNNFSIRSFHDRFFSVTKEGVCRADAEKPGEQTSLHFETPPVGAVALARAKFLASPKALLDEPWPWLAAVVLIIIVDLILRIF